MELTKSFVLVMALTIGLILASSPMGESASVKGFLKTIFSSSTPTNNAPALSPSFAPAPAPSMLRRSSFRRFAPFFSSTPSAPGLVVGFYDDKCNSDIEDLIETLITEEFDNDPTISAAFFRLQFHDCFVTGCDSSLLIDGPTTEKTAGSNLSVRGYEVIERIKKAIEENCPGVVSCSDIVAVCVKVLIKLSGGLDYPVETGRRDGIVSRASDVKLPSPDMTIDQAFAFFSAKNFTLEEMVVLLGYHAVGNAHCNNFQDRLFQGNKAFDPLIEKSLLSKLRNVCPQGAVTNNEALLNQDPANNNTLDNGFYNQLIGNRGVLALDQLLARDPSTSAIVTALAQNITLFNIRTAQVMIKLQAVEVLTGSDGEIRKVCSKIN